MTDTTREPAAPANTGRLDFEVQGMTCGSCAVRVQRVLGRQPGVASAEVNFATGKAQVAPTGPSTWAACGLRWSASAIASNQPGPVRRRMPRRRLRPHGVGGWWWPSRWRRRWSPWPCGLAGRWRSSRPAWPRSSWPRRCSSGSAGRSCVRPPGGPGGVPPTWTPSSPWAPGRLRVLSGPAGHGGMDLYFEAAAVIITFVVLGRYFEARAKGRAGQAIRALLELGAKEARWSGTAGGHGPGGAGGSRRPARVRPARRSPPTARWSPAPARSTSPCSPASRCRSRRRLAIR